jgi:quercetin dioxygenase-like cupin family protein
MPVQHFVVKELTPKQPVEGVKIRVISGDRMTMAFFELNAGARIPEHSHHHEQMGTVLKGSIELMVDGEKRRINQGEAYHIPSNVPHSGECGGSAAEILEVFSPRRDDYAKM